MAVASDNFRARKDFHNYRTAARTHRDCLSKLTTTRKTHEDPVWSRECSSRHRIHKSRISCKKHTEVSEVIDVNNYRHYFPFTAIKYSV